MAAALTACTAFAAVGCGTSRHVLVKVDAHDATCTAAGNIEYYKCYDPECNKLFADELGENEVSADSVVIPAGGHKLVAVGTPSDPTCTDGGVTAGEKCSVCGTLITAQEVLTPKGHHATKVNAVAATCTTPGTVEYYACDDCDGNFLDENCEVVANNIAIKPLGHDYGEWQYAGNGKHKKVCSHDATHAEIVDCSYGKISEFDDETGHYLTCGICNGKSEKLPHDLKWFLEPETNTHRSECRSCDYETASAPHAPAELLVEVVGSKLYGGRTITASNLVVAYVCECGHQEDVAAEDVVFEDAVLVDGVNTLSVTVGEKTDSFTYDAPEEPSFAFKVVGATFEDGTDTLQLKEGEKVTDTPTPAAGKTFLGYRVGVDVYSDLSEFEMPDQAVTMYAIYEEDTVHFAPADRAQPHFSTEAYEHVVLDDGTIATRFVWDDDAAHQVQKLPHSGGDTGSHKVNVYSPAHKTSLMFVYVVNNGDKDAKIRYQAENYGVKGEVEIVAEAGKTTVFPFQYSNEESSSTTFPTCDHIIELISERAAGETVTLDIYGKLVSTENNKLTGISVDFPEFYKEGDRFDLSQMSVKGNISGYAVSIFDYDCSIEDGAEWTPEITEVTVSALGFEKVVKLNDYSTWIATRFSHNLAWGGGTSISWLDSAFVYDDASGLPATQLTFKAGGKTGNDNALWPQNDNADENGYNVRIPTYADTYRQLRIFVENKGTESISFRLYAENNGAKQGVDITVAGGESKVFDLSVNPGGSIGCNYNIKLLQDVTTDTPVVFYAYFKTYENEFGGISVNANSTHTTTFAVGETFNTKKLTVDVSNGSGYANGGEVNIANVTTDLDGHVFTADDIGEKTVTVTWNGLTTTYTINVVAA